MRLKNKIFLCVFVSLLFLISSGVVFADEAPAMELVENGTVSRDAQVISTNSYGTSENLEYSIPDNIDEIRSANVILSSYSGSGGPNYALYSNITILALHQVENEILPEIEISSLATPWNSGIYAGVDNNLTVKINNKESVDLENVNIEIYSNESGEFLATYNVDSLAPGASSIVINDPTVRELTERTVWPDAQNNKIKYTVVVKYADEIISNASFNKIVAYDGYLNKTYAYNGLSNRINRNYTITGDIIVASQPTDVYMDQFSRQRTETWNISVPDDSTLVKAFLYFNYNWDTSYFADGWTLTFNGNEITDEYIFWDTDKGNLGQWGIYQYGTLVFDVSDYFVNGENSFNITKTGNCALYPSTLFVLYNSTRSATVKDVYFVDICDVLYNYYNKEYINKTNVYIPYNGINVTDLENATWYVFAGSADGENDGNLLFNGKEFTHLWDDNGTTTSCYAYIADVSDVIGENNEAWYLTDLEKMTTVVIYEQLLVVTRVDELIPTEITAEDVSVVYNDTSSRLIVELKDVDGNPISGAKVRLTVGNLTKSMKTFASGKAYISTGSLDIGDYVATVTFAGDNHHASASATANVVVRASTVLTADDVSVVYQDANGKLIVVLNDAEGNPISGAKIRFTLGNLTKSMNTNAKGKAYIGTKSLDIGNYVATVTYAGDDYYTPASATAKVSVRAGTVLTANDTAVVYQDASGRLIVQLKDADGNPISGAKVKITVGNLTKTMNTYASGKAFISTKSLDLGDYVATVTYAGDDYYAPATVTANVAVKKTATVLTAADVVATQGDASKLIAQLKDTEGNPIRGVKVKFTLGNLTKSMLTNDNGRAYINTRTLTPGNYTAVISYAGNEDYTPSSINANVLIQEA